jgi:hypothetical protein
MKSNRSSILIAALFCAFLAACGALGIGVTKIGDIVANPSNFDGKEVKVKGKVASVNKVPLINAKFYTLRDDTGEITVVAGEKLPAEDSTIVVKGRVDAAAIVQGSAVGLRLTELEVSSF